MRKDAMRQINFELLKKNPKLVVFVKQIPDLNYISKKERVEIYNKIIDSIFIYCP